MVSKGVALNPIELWASVPDNDMLYGLRVRRANGETVMLNPALLTSTLLPLATAEQVWWVLKADHIVVPRRRGRRPLWRRSSWRTSRSGRTFNLPSELYSGPKWPTGFQWPVFIDR
ncbi:hypothetical protein GT755_00225 [Herbidospora sp. NEAU-GS84]|uniref:Uncharacterized protein n=1 Tax=Herbidospora solisilvae TaxID=2696284 RepID=A0A7C9IZU1_9ACTN|nr:hypothetical protein [Herbidospora solisilvae]NAS20105.1 hypothetical protein [Herbidospora solisilvae]